jgi:hypothetical protein
VTSSRSDDQSCRQHQQALAKEHGRNRPSIGAYGDAHRNLALTLARGIRDDAVHPDQRERACEDRKESKQVGEQTRSRAFLFEAGLEPSRRSYRDFPIDARYGRTQFGFPRRRLRPTEIQEGEAAGMLRERPIRIEQVVVGVRLPYVVDDAHDPRQ